MTLRLTSSMRPVDACAGKRVFSRSATYHDLGGRYLADRDKHRVTQHLIRRLQSLGVEVEVKVA